MNGASPGAMTADSPIRPRSGILAYTSDMDRRNLMARVTHFVEGVQTVRAHPTRLECYYQALDDETGSRLLHLSTFGSADRESKPKSSQSIQLDRRAARELIGVIEQAFPGLVSSGVTWSG